MAAPRAQVAVVGAGPVGCVAAAVLVDRGVRVTLFEAAPELPRELRASTFHPATLELLHGLDVVDALIERGLVAPRFAYRDRRRGQVASFDIATVADVTRYPFRLQCEQYKLCEILLDRLQIDDRFDICFGASVEGAADHGDHAELTLADGVTHRFDAVFAADGAASNVRKSLGLGFDGITYEDRYVLVSTPYELADHLPDLAYVNYISDPDEWLVLLRTVDLWRALFPVDAGESDDEALSDEACERRLQSVVARSEHYEIGHRTIYRVHQRVTDTFRVGRVVLAGDAAHINNPLGGMGMNGGVHDAILLGAGLAGVLDGTLGDERLDHYAEMRRRLAIEFVRRHTHQNAVSLSAPDSAARKKALDAIEARAADPVEARAFVMQASMLTAIDEMRDELAEVGL
ncbi:MAG: NAD(P)/FAD-dependent oxidoreductase [Actinomycetota bacterium]